MTVYLDTCALNRLTDDLSHPRVLAESDAVLHVLELISAGEVRWLTSDFVRREVLRNPDPIKLAQTLPLLDMASGHIHTTTGVIRRAKSLEAQGFDPFDALHLAACEASSVDALLTVDDRLVGRAARLSGSAVTRVLNPVDWLQRRGAWPRKLSPQT